METMYLKSQTVTNSPYNNTHPIFCHSLADLFKDMCDYKFDFFLVDLANLPQIKC